MLYPIPVQSLGRCFVALICGLPNLQHFYHWERLLTVFLVVKQQVVVEALGTSRNKVCCNDFLKPLLAVFFCYTTFLRIFYVTHCNYDVSLKFTILKDGLYLKDIFSPHKSGGKSFPHCRSVSVRTSCFQDIPLRIAL